MSRGERTAVVTGCAGFLGSHLAEALLAAGHRVIGVDAFDDAYPAALKRANVAPLLAHPRFALREADLADPARAAAVASGARAEVVVHLAARGGIRDSMVDPARTVRSNVLPTQHVLDTWGRAGSAIVLASSSAVYGDDTPAPFDEAAPCTSPVSPYGASKRASELLACAAHAAFGTAVTIVRPFTVYGRRQRPDLAIRRFATAMLRGEEIVVHGDGSMARDFTHVEDATRALVAAAAEREGLRVLNVGSAAPRTVRETVDELARAMGAAPRVRHVPRPPGEMDVTFADVRRARERWGWAPRVAFADGIADFVAWLRDEERAGRNP